jgi:hypothetical protein
MVTDNGACSILKSPQDALSALRHWNLTRDDTGASRVYRDRAGTVYHSVTSILSATSDTTGLEQWAAGMDRIYGAGAAEQERDTAAKRGTQTHSQAEYLLKTASKLARNTANRTGTYRVGPDGLYRLPSPVYTWALAKAAERLPPVSWSAKGYARSLTGWITQNITQCFACEFSIHHPAGFAGTADGLVSVGPEALLRHGLDPALAGAPFIADWKTSARRKSAAGLENYRLQAGAYSLGLQHLTGIRPAGAFIVLARRVGPPDIQCLNQDELVLAEDGYLARVQQFYSQLERSG